MMCTSWIAHIVDIVYFGRSVGVPGLGVELHVMSVAGFIFLASNSQKVSKKLPLAGIIERIYATSSIDPTRPQDLADFYIYGTRCRYARIFSTDDARTKGDDCGMPNLF